MIRSALRHVSAALALLLIGSAASAETFWVGTLTQGSSSYGTGAAIAKALVEHGRFDARVQPHSGNQSFVGLLNAGQIQFGIANVFEAYAAVNGKGPYNGKTNPNIRLLGSFFPFTVALYVHKTSGIETISQLKGKRVASGFISQKVLYEILKGQLANGGLGEADVVPVPAPGIVRAADDFTAGKTDAFFFTIGSGKTRETDAAVGGIRALPIEDSPAALAAMRRFIPVAYARVVKPGSHAVGVAQPMKLMAYDSVVMVGAAVPEDVAYRAAKALYDGKATLTAAFGSFGEFEVSEMSRRQEGVEYHPGAIRFFRDKGIWPPKN